MTEKVVWKPTPIMFIYIYICSGERGTQHYLNPYNIIKHLLIIVNFINFSGWGSYYPKLPLLWAFYQAPL